MRNAMTMNPKALAGGAASAVLLSVLSAGCVTSPPQVPAPYPRSEVVRGVRWDLTTVPELRSALGSDLWPLAWAADGDLYGAWGDGGGFEGGESEQMAGKASLGFARITGTPRAGQRSSYRGHNLWGVLPYAENEATFGGKVGDLISLDGTLYAQGGLWTRENCNCADPIKKGETNSTRTLAWSSDFGKSWTLASWTSPSDLGSTLQFGRDYEGALDPLHVYLYYQRNVSTDPTHVYLRRINKDAIARDPATPGHFEYFAGLDPDEAPRWSRNESDATAVFADDRVRTGVYMAPEVVYDAALGRFFMIAFHGALTGEIGVFEAGTPWGPWATVAYYDDWGGFNESAGEGNGMTFPAKWISPDGRTLWAVFSGVKTSEANDFDSFNVAKLVIRTRRGMPRIRSRSPTTPLTAGAAVTVRGAGRNLTWTASRLRIEADQVVLEQIARGSGSSLNFTVPAHAAAGEIIRVRLTAQNIGSVYRDYPIAAPQ